MSTRSASRAFAHQLKNSRSVNDDNNERPQRRQRRSTAFSTNSTHQVARQAASASTTTVVDSPRSAGEPLRLGLELVGFEARRARRARHERGLSRFRSARGVGPETVEQLLSGASHRGVAEEPDPVWLFIALSWVRVCNAEELAGGVFGADKKTTRERAWEHTLAIRKLNLQATDLVWARAGFSPGAAVARALCCSKALWRASSPSRRRACS